jgi:hypothetical protein
MGQRHDPDIEHRLVEATHLAQPLEIAVLLREAARLICRLRSDIDELVLVKREDADGTRAQAVPDPGVAAPAAAQGTGETL